MITFKGSPFEREVIPWGVRCYVAEAISYRQLGEMMQVRGVEVDHSTLNRWVLKMSLDKQFRAQTSGRVKLASEGDLSEGQGQELMGLARYTDTGIGRICSAMRNAPSNATTRRLARRPAGCCRGPSRSAGSERR